ncbi:MAG TPA: ABC transporter permease subunit [Actinomycetaceae bacterium]|nr:ABC transporter permease subunit [Actinomycetaceae bacterium]
MTLFLDALRWLVAPEQWEGRSTLMGRVAEHLSYSMLALLIAAVIAVPVGYAVGHTGRGKQFVVGLSGAARALPSLGLLTVLTLLVGVGEAVVAATVVFVLLGVPSILAGAYSGIDNIDPQVRDAARAMGMTRWQMLSRVEIPLGLPLLLGGVRNAALQIVATAVLAAYVGLGGLGTYILRGIPLRRYDETLGGALAIVAVALVVDGFFAVAQRAATRLTAHPTRSNRRTT